MACWLDAYAIGKTVLHDKQLAKAVPRWFSLLLVALTCQ
jgi:hypothetical protein